MQKKNYIQPFCSLVVVDESEDVLDATIIQGSTQGQTGENNGQDELGNDAKKAVGLFSREAIFFDDSAAEEDDESSSVLDDIVSW